MKPTTINQAMNRSWRLAEPFIIQRPQRLDRAFVGGYTASVCDLHQMILEKGAEAAIKQIESWYHDLDK